MQITQDFGATNAALSRGYIAAIGSTVAATATITNVYLSSLVGSGKTAVVTGFTITSIDSVLYTKVPLSLSVGYGTHTQSVAGGGAVFNKSDFSALNSVFSVGNPTPPTGALVVLQDIIHTSAEFYKLDSPIFVKPGQFLYLAYKTPASTNTKTCYIDVEFYAQ